MMLLDTEGAQFAGGVQDPLGEKVRETCKSAKNGPDCHHIRGFALEPLGGPQLDEWGLPPPLRSADPVPPPRASSRVNGRSEASDKGVASVSSPAH